MNAPKNPVKHPPVTVIIPPTALPLLNALQRADPALFSAAVQAGLSAVPPFPPPPGLGQDTGTDFLTGIQNFISTNLPTYLQYKLATNAPTTAQNVTAAQTQAALAQQGIGVAGSSMTKYLLIGGGVLLAGVAAVMLLKKKKR